MDTVPAADQVGIELKSCPGCSAQMPDSAGFCPGCGRAMRRQSAARERVGALRENLLGALAYVTFLPALGFLLLESYRRNSFLRFHSVQCLFFWLISIAAAVLIRVLVLLLLFVPVVGPLLAVLVVTIAALAALFTWIVLVVKAFQGARFGLPLLGDLAEQYSGST